MSNGEEGKQLNIDSGGPSVQVVESVRKMKTYIVTDSELKSLSLANSLVAIFASLSAAFFSFGLDITKDLLLTPETADKVRQLGDIVRYGCFSISAVFALACAWAYGWRADAIRLIKKESGDDEAYGISRVIQWFRGKSAK